MPQLRFVPAVAASAVFFVSSLASAIVAPGPGCGTGPACAYGFECIQTGASGGGCAPSEACPPGAACPAPEPCTRTIEYGCVPAHCTQDADCSSGMVCHAWEEPCVVTDCACAPDTPNCGCDPVACNPQAVSMCTPRYDLPCTVAADCGAGFACEEAQNCGCASSGGAATPPSSGSGGASSSSGAAPTPPPGGSSADAAPVPPPIDCGCAPSGVRQCVPNDINCQTAAQCPAGWLCEVQGGPVSAPACAPGQNCTTPAPQPAVSKCVPPYYGAQSGGDLEVPTSATGSGSGTGGSTTGTGTGTGPGKGTGAATGGPTGNPATPQPESAGNGQAHESSACAMGHAPASSGALALLAMLGALFGLKRRRA